MDNYLSNIHLETATHRPGERGGGGKINIPIGIVHSDIQEVCVSSRILTARVLKFPRGMHSGMQLLYWLPTWC